MQLKKTIISFLLIIAYSVGFAHELIPHYHVEDGVNIGANEELHHHVTPNERDLNDITHDDHLDDNFLDFLVCIISHSEHSSHDNLEALHQGTDLSIDKSAPSNLMGLNGTEEPILIPLKKSTKVRSKPCVSHWIERSSVQSRRGPPIFS